MAAWISKAEELAGRLELHRATLSDLRERGVPAHADGEQAQSPSAAPERWRFDSPEDQWQHDNLVGLVAGLEQLRERGIPAMEERLETARTIRPRSVDLQREAWDAAIESIGDRSECPLYDGLRLTPQVGLVPIGRDPASGLWEFAHLETGSVPRRNAEGALEIGEECGLVFALVPGGTVRIGALEGDPFASPNELPAVQVTLAPYFLAKHEMTQGQWRRVMRQNPSAFHAGYVQERGTGLPPRTFNPLHPVESVSWHDCEEAMQRLGLRLPSEAQWERAARAGTETAWWSGADRESLRGAANVADVAGARIGASPDLADYDDDYEVHAPIGSFAANPFGLHDVYGNVWEWCRDGFADYTTATFEAGTGDTDASPSRGSGVVRGGASDSTSAQARSACRGPLPLATRVATIGLRPARAIEP
jgi:formylglycine-generating enzyme required for sulfatase activity